MTTRFTDAIRNGMADAIETAVGSAPVLELRTGAEPATAATAASGTLLVSMSLPADWMTAASGGAKALAGVWSGVAVATGTAGYYRIIGANTIQGSVSQRASDGGTGDLQLAQATAGIVAGQTITVSAYALTTTGA